MKDCGQLSLEYMFIFMMMLIVFSIISIPLFTDSLKNTQDVTDVIKVKNTLNQLSSEVKYIYYSDEGTKKTKGIYIPRDMKIEYKLSYGRHYLSTNIKLNDNTTKTVMTEVPCKVTFKSKCDKQFSSPL